MKNMKFGYLPETIGIGIGQGDEGWGFVVRETTPRPFVAGEHKYIPIFSLFSGDSNSPADDPLLVQLIRLHGEEAMQFTISHIIDPIISSWVRTYKERGIIFGAHSQNVLLEVDRNLYPTRIIHRDLDLQVDPTIRKVKGLHMDFPKSLIGIDVKEPLNKVLSLKYDIFMGHHLFSYISQVLEKYFAVDPKLFREKVKEVFHREFVDADNFFDNRVYYYSSEPSVFNEYPLVDVGEPEWR
jgi:siderophore synthetase component